MFIWLHNTLPNSILIDLWLVSIYWYGFLMMLAVVFGFGLVVYVSKKYKIYFDYIFNLIFYLIIFGLVGARIYHVLNELVYYLSNPFEIFSIWNGGLAFHGALLAGIAVFIVYFNKCGFMVSGYKDLITKSCGVSIKYPEIKIKSKKKYFDAKYLNWNIFSKLLPRISNLLSILKKKEFLLILDIFSPALALGQAVGRWGNYFNQELYGLPTSLPWGIPIELENRVIGFESFKYFHPTFLYESLLLIVLFLLLSWMHRVRLIQIRNYSPAVSVHNFDKYGELRNNEKVVLGNKQNLTLSGGDKFSTSIESEIGVDLKSFQQQTCLQGKVQDDEKLKSLPFDSKFFKSGLIFAVYIIFSSVVRIGMEFLRIDRTPDVFGIRLPILIAGLLIIVGIWLVWYTRRVDSL